MKFNFLLFVTIILFSCCKKIYSKNDYYIVALRRKKTDNDYIDESKAVQNKIDEFVNESMNDIYEVIEDNKESYILNNGEMDKKLEEFENNSLKKRNNPYQKYFFINKNRDNSVSFKRSLENNSIVNPNNSTIEFIPIESELVSHICPITNYYTIRVYLSEETAEIVCNLDNVLYCEVSSKLKFIDIKSKKNNNLQNNIAYKDAIKRKRNEDLQNNIYYDKEAIIKETNWSDVSTQYLNVTNEFPEFSNYLSLLSQSPNIGEENELDKIFYYPSTAGKGIDIYLIDDGIIVDHEDYNTDDRTVSCDAIIKDNLISEISNSINDSKLSVI